MASFLAEVKNKYNSLLVANGIITVEMLKAALKDKDTTGKFLLSFGDTIVEWDSESVNLYVSNVSWTQVIGSSFLFRQIGRFNASQ